MTDNERIAQIEARCNAASPGPWTWEPSWPEGQVLTTGGLRDGPWHAIARRRWDNELADAAFILAAREDVPWLLNRLREAKAQIAHLLSAASAANAKATRLELELRRPSRRARKG